jgi:hypothetical protein
VAVDLEAADSVAVTGAADSVAVPPEVEAEEATAFPVAVEASMAVVPRTITEQT